MDGLHAQTNPKHRHPAVHRLLQHVQQLGMLFRQSGARRQHKGVGLGPIRSLPLPFFHDTDTGPTRSKSWTKFHVKESRQSKRVMRMG